MGPPNWELSPLKYVKHVLNMLRHVLNMVLNIVKHCYTMLNHPLWWGNADDCNISESYRDWFKLRSCNSGQAAKETCHSPS